MNIHRALSDIAEIRAQLDRTETYRGFRSVAVGVSVVFLVFAAFAERTWVADPLFEVDKYLAVWFSVAVASALMASVEMWIRSRKSDNAMVTKMHWSLCRQIAPSLIVGFVLTALVASHALEQESANTGMMWALPGIWSMLYGVGLSSCQKHLPTQTIGVAAYFVIVGTFILANNWFTRELAGWQMLVSFGIGQMLLAVALFWNLERRQSETA